MRNLILAILLLAVATPVLAGDFYKSTRRGHGSTSSHLSRQGIVGGRSVGPSYYTPRYYDRGYRSHRYSRPTERIIIIERDRYSPRRYR